MAAASLRASATISGGTGANVDASTVGKTQYGYSPAAVGDQSNSPNLHATTLIVAILVELALFAAARHYFRDVLGG